jgi:FAD/FMN-containing dehydrogenase
MVAVGSWGRLEFPEHDVHVLGNRVHVAHDVMADLPGLAYGNGRSYGDVCLNPRGTLWQTRGLDRMIEFDAGSGRLVCEPGVLLRDIQRMMIPRGWALPVTPGTQLATVGGAIANDVHGKNHHVRGSFGDHVLRIVLLRTDGTRIVCGPDMEPGWFAATVGGAGLTGLVVEAAIQLMPVPGPWLATETIPYANLDEFFALADASEADWEYTVSWIDCLSGDGRGIFMRANPVAADLPAPAPHSRTVPFTPPVSAINWLSLRAMNTAYFNMNKWRAGPGVAHYEKFFYPLDNLLEWNRMYGPRGFYQHQSVVPRAGGQAAVQAMLREIAASGEGSFLAVLKTFGERAAPGMLSFPQPGVTLALDFPNRGARTHKLFRRLDAIVQAVGGRIYLAKDASMPRTLFEAGYPRLAEFLRYRDPGISSAMSRRLMGT